VAGSAPEDRVVERQRRRERGVAPGCDGWWTRPSSENGRSAVVAIVAADCGGDRAAEGVGGRPDGCPDRAGQLGFRGPADRSRELVVLQVARPPRRADEERLEVWLAADKRQSVGDGHR
jgi:hypothetical protein